VVISAGRQDVRFVKLWIGCFSKLHFFNSCRCECLFKLYKLAIGIIYKNLKPHKDLDSKDRLIFKNSIKILNLLTFNSYDLTQKYVTEFAQFKEIVHTLIYIYDMDLAKRLIIFDLL
jgi:hypothetical protein